MPTASPHLKNDVGVPEPHFLENARFNLRWQHRLAVANR
jgi:hypothetical protein